MKQEKVHDLLQRIAEQDTPSQIDLWPTIYAQLQFSKGTPQFRLRLSKPLRWAIAGFVFFFLGSGVTLTVESLLQRAIQMDAGLNDAYLRDYGQAVDLSQTVGDFTFTIQWIYGDRERIAIGYSITTHTDSIYNNFNLIAATLVDQNGHVFEPRSLLGAGVIGNTGSYAGTFTRPDDTPIPTMYHMRFVAYVHALDATAITELASQVRGPHVLDRPEDLGLVIGPFTFTIDVPVRPQ